MKVYVAGASSEIERAESVIARLRQLGITITCTWTENIRKVGHGNPKDASHEQRRKWSYVDLQEVIAADVLLFLLPVPPNTTFGAWVESGVAFTKGKPILLSGVNHNIFVGLGAEPFETDTDAIEAIVAINRAGIYDQSRWIP